MSRLLGFGHRQLCVPSIKSQSKHFYCTCSPDKFLVHIIVDQFQFMLTWPGHMYYVVVSAQYQQPLTRLSLKDFYLLHKLIIITFAWSGDLLLHTQVYNYVYTCIQLILELVKTSSQSMSMQVIQPNKSFYFGSQYYQLHVGI